jgi:hypothetical protein
MTQSALISPIELQYTAHRDAETRRRETREWLERRERELSFISDAPSMVPEKRDQH